MKHKTTADSKSRSGTGSLTGEIISLVDEYADLHSNASFLCSAMASVMSTDMPVREEMIQGAKNYVEMLQQRLQNFRERLDKLSKHAVAESKRGKMIN